MSGAKQMKIILKQTCTKSKKIMMKIQSVI